MKMYLCCTIAACGLAAFAGYEFSRSESNCSLGKYCIPATEYFVSEQTFSEIGTARLALNATANRVLSEIRSRIVQTASSDGRTNDKSFQKSIRELEQAISELKDTPEELLLTNDLLVLLRREEKYEEWLTVYLRNLYSHPTAELIAGNARIAMEIAARAGRQEDLSNELNRIARLPIEFSARDRLLSAVTEVHPLQHAALKTFKSNRDENATL